MFSRQWREWQFRVSVPLLALLALCFLPPLLSASPEPVQGTAPVGVIREDLNLSCSSVYDDVDDQAKLCSMVTWLSAQMYSGDNYSLYYPLAPFSIQEQDEYARSFYRSLRDQIKSDRPSCKNALKHLACAQVFPE